jgi:hypothetical protein
MRFMFSSLALSYFLDCYKPAGASEENTAFSGCEDCSIVRIRQYIPQNAGNYVQDS